MDKNLPDFSRGLKQARKRAGYRTQKDLRAALYEAGMDVTVDTIENWEQGKSSPPLETFLKLCDFFGCSADFLLGRIGEKNHDLHFICGYTGLAEESAEALHFFRETYGRENIEIIDLLLYDSLYQQKGSPSRSILSLLHYFFSIDIRNTAVYSITSSGHILKEQGRPTGYINSAMYFDAHINENAALMELQETLSNFKRNFIDSRNRAG